MPKPKQYDYLIGYVFYDAKGNCGHGRRMVSTTKINPAYVVELENKITKENNFENVIITSIYKF